MIVCSILNTHKNATASIKTKEDNDRDGTNRSNETKRVTLFGHNIRLDRCWDTGSDSSTGFKIESAEPSSKASAY